MARPMRGRRLSRACIYCRMAMENAGSALEAEIHACRRCPRLVEWREEAAADPPKRYRGEDYWARPVAGFGDPRARLAIVGLAPAAHGANRTGRMFTGDRSGDWLYAALHRAGLRQPADVGRSRRRAPARRAPTSPRSSAARRPPTSRPRTSATTACPIWSASWSCCADCRTVVALGSFAWDGALRALRDLGAEIPRPKPRFGHGAEAEVGRLDAARLLPPEPAEHVHRQADRADARRRLRPRR